MAFDRNNDGQVTREEAPEQMQSVVALADLNDAEAVVTIHQGNNVLTPIALTGPLVTRPYG